MLLRYVTSLIVLYGSAAGVLAAELMMFTQVEQVTLVLRVQQPVLELQVLPECLVQSEPLDL